MNRNEGQAKQTGAHLMLHTVIEVTISGNLIIPNLSIQGEEEC